MKELLNQYKVHLYALLVLFVVSAAFVPQSFQGKALQQSDIKQYNGAATELDYYKNTQGEILHWTNSQFAGMPTYMISGLTQELPLRFLQFPNKPAVWAKIFLYLLCGYIMFISFGVRPWIAVIGAIGMGFATENFTIIGVGHNTKAMAIAYLPLVIAGCQYLFRKRYLLGLNLVALGLGLEILVNHLQITYYGAILIGLFFVFQLVEHIKQKRIKDYLIATCIAAGGAILAVASNSLPLLLTNEYSKVTIRAKSDLTIKKEGDKIVPAETIDGLTESYAFSYSNGWTDIFATFIPNYSGGDSDKTGLYYGDIGGTSGPKYVGAGLFILMALGFVLLQGSIRWWLLTGMLLAIVLSFGQNHFKWFNDFMYNYVPLYNKFRAPSMIMVLVQYCVGLLAILGLEQIFSLSKKDEGTFKKIKFAGFGTLGFIVFLTFFSTLFNDFNTNPQYDEVTGEMIYDGDTRYAQSALQQNNQQVTQDGIDRFKERIAEARIEAMKKDAYRTLFFAGAIFLVIWFFYKEKLEGKYALIIIGLLITADMWTVGKRYLNEKDFKNKSLVDNPVIPYDVDRSIQLDSSYYRVLDLTVNPLADTRTSFFHKSLGGYNAAKIRRYQEIWDWYLMPDLQQGRVQDNRLLNMLNTKYIIFPNRQQQNAQPQYTANPQALGNAWFVNNIKVVESADSAIVNLGSFDPKSTAIVEKQFADLAIDTQIDSNARIELLSYHPEKLIYKSSSTTDGFAVFSEIYYKAGWNAYIDNKKVEHAQVNYVLRGLPIPAGEHSVEFRFEPATYATGKQISYVASGAIYLLLIGSLAFWLKGSLQAKKA